jgi:hypothetical protein
LPGEEKKMDLINLVDSWFLLDTAPFSSTLSSTSLNTLVKDTGAAYQPSQIILEALLFTMRGTNRLPLLFPALRNIFAMAPLS